jgi:ABC-2 type transport system permease protein
MKFILYTAYYQTLMFLRIKQATFFALAFPIFLFILFGNLFGSSKGDTFNVMSGVIGMTIASSGFFGIGTVIKDYYSSGWLKYLKNLPIRQLNYFIGLIISRLLVLFTLVLVLNLLSFFVFAFTCSVIQLLHIFIGIIVGYTIFCFLGLCLSFSNIKYASETGLSSLIYYIILFSSTAFYPVCDFNKVICTIGNILPLNPILHLIRFGKFEPILFFWMGIPILLFLFLLNKLKYNR